MTCTCEPYKPCAACQEISPYEECSSCGEVAFDWPRCRACGGIDEIYLHDRVKAAMCVAPLSELKRTGTGGWL